MSAKALKLYNTFTRSLNEVKLNGKSITTNFDSQHPIAGSFYICGPTVYSQSHVGHAITYIRSDLLRRFLKSFFNVKLHTVMNITDIDDKILDQTSKEFGHEYDGAKFPSDPQQHPFRRISEKCYSSFLNDMRSIRVLPADLYIKVSDSVELICNFIRRLEINGNAYIANSGDIHFKVQSLKNYVGRTDSRKESQSTSKQDARDFVLWKAMKPNEPVWLYKSGTSDRCIPGRPGWHVQCSAISSAIFGEKLDFHFGGKDLIFPHHYNEEACSCAFHSLNTSNTMHVWAKNWLHSGHLILRDAKMSKSLGNVIEINNFIGRSSLNALRLLCIFTHYRSDVEFNEDLMDKLKALDHRLNAFISFINAQLRKVRENVDSNLDPSSQHPSDAEFEHLILDTQASIVAGVCDDFHLDHGLQAILELSKRMYSMDTASFKAYDLISCWALITDWCQTCGLEYGETSSTAVADSATLADLLMEFRNQVRSSVLTELKARKDVGSQLKDLLNDSDNIRTKLDELGYVVRDKKA